MLSITSISKSYGIQQVLNQITFTLGDQQRIGLVGANGVGKSTLIKIITGEIEPDSGSITLTHGTQIGYLAQTVFAPDGSTIETLIADSMRELHQIDARLRELEMLMSSQADLAAVLDEYQSLLEQFERKGGYEMDYRVDLVLNGLGVGHLPRDREVSTLSGGEKARIALAMLLLQAPDILLLDEPTNHLDYQCLGWLESYLSAYRGGMLIVSHDRQFLDRTVTHILEIEEHSRESKFYTGDYSAYLIAKRQERRRWEQDYERQQEELKELRHVLKTSARQVSSHNRPIEGDKFLRGFKKGRVAVAISRQIASVEERVKRIEDDPIPEPPDDLRFEADFDPQVFKGRAPITVSGISKSYSSRTILEAVHFTLSPNSRIALVGANGAGKSTLLKILAGREVTDTGEVIVNPQIRIGYLDQEDADLDPRQTVFEAYRAGLEGQDQQHKAILLTSGLFRYEELDRPISVLSAGQKRKLQIARLMATRANVLLLDEPTNFVSFEVLESFEAALKTFPGVIIAASHDRRFLSNFDGEIWEVRDGQIMTSQTIPTP